jgi:hypothetical protein
MQERHGEDHQEGQSSAMARKRDRQRGSEKMIQGYCIDGVCAVGQFGRFINHSLDRWHLKRIHRHTNARASIFAERDTRKGVGEWAVEWAVAPLLS